MDLKLTLVSPDTMEPVTSWESDTLVDALRASEDLDIVSYVPQEALSSSWVEDAQVTSLIHRLAALSASTTPLETYKKREVDMTPEDWNVFHSERTVSHTSFTQDGYTVYEYSVHAQELDMNAPTYDRAEVKTLLALLEEGRREGYLLGDSLYEAPSSVSTEETATTENTAEETATPPEE